MFFALWQLFGNICHSVIIFILVAVKWQGKQTKRLHVFSKFLFEHKLTNDIDILIILSLTGSIGQNEALVPHGHAQAIRGTRPSFYRLYCCWLGKHSQIETSFKTNFLSMKGENSITSYCIVLMYKLAKIWWLIIEIWVFWSIWYMLYMDDDSEHNVDDSDDGWVLDSE